MSNTVKIYDSAGKLAREARNLWVITDHARRLRAVSAVYIAEIPINGEGRLFIRFPNGDTCVTGFASMAVLREWCAKRRIYARAVSWPAAVELPITPGESIRAEPIGRYRRHGGRVQYEPFRNEWGRITSLDLWEKPWRVFSPDGTCVTHTHTLREAIEYFAGKGIGFSPRAHQIAAREARLTTTTTTTEGTPQ